MIVKRGIIICYCHSRGKVELEDGGVLPFGSSFFHSGRPCREPKVGDKVEAVFQDSRLIYIRKIRVNSSVWD